MDPRSPEAYLGGSPFGSPKSYSVYGLENEIAAVTFFAKTGAALTNRSAFASHRMAGSRDTVANWRSLAPPACCSSLPFKAPCCLELFGCCCRRLSQHGVGEVLIPLRHCWRDVFFCVCVGSGWFCHDWASHCSVFLLSFDGLLVFGFPPFAP